MSNRDTIERAIRHIDSCLDVDPWARDIAIDAMKKELKNLNEELKNSNGTDINVGSMDIVYRQDVEDMLQNALPSRGMWEIEGDVAKNAICETVVDLMMDLEKLPSAQPEPREVIPHRNYQYLSDYWCQCGWHLGKKGDVKYCPECGRKVIWDG